MREPSTTVAKPKNADAGKNAGESDLPPIPSRLKKDKVDVGNLPSFKSNVDIVTVDVAVLDNKGHFIPGIPPGNFRVLEDNVPQQIRGVNMGEAPMTVAMVIEFSNLFQQYWGPAWYQTLQLAWGFANTLKPEDYVAVVAYDLRTEILADFTTDRSKVQEALSRLQIPGFSECNLFDAITDTADRMSGIEGRKAIVADRFGHRHLQPYDLRPVPQVVAAIRRAHLCHWPDADAARFDRRPRRHGIDAAHGFSPGR